MDETLQKVLLSIRDFLERLTQSPTLNADQVTEAHMAVTALTYQIARSTYPDEALVEARRKADEVTESIGVSGANGAPNRRWGAQWRAGVGAGLTTGLEKDAPTDLIPTVEAVRDFLVTYHSPMDPAVSAGTKATYQGGRGDAANRQGAAPLQIEITAPTFEAYLNARDPGAQARVIEVKRLMGGYSKQTYIIRLEERGSERTIVVRKDGLGLPTGSSVASEYPVLREVHAAGVAVPEPLWLEPAETSPFATAFIVVSYAAGQPANHIMPTEPAMQHSWADSIGRAMARLHNATRVTGADVRAPLLAEIDDLQRRIEDRERTPHPGLVIGMNWLRDNLDALAGRPACRIHGDVGFHNFLMRDDKLLAVLDWEFSRIGDPAEDLILMKSFMDQIDGWEAFLAAYRAECDFAIDERAARYFHVWREVRNLVACLGSLNSLLLPQVKDVALCVAGTIYIPKYEVAVLDAILEVEQQNV